MQKCSGYQCTLKNVYLRCLAYRRIIDFIGWGITLEVTRSNHLYFVLDRHTVVLYNISLKGNDMATEKTLNYTPEMTAELVETYKASPSRATVEALAAKLGKSTRSIVAKLSKEGAYVPEAKEAGKRAMLKSEMVAEIAALVGKDEEVLESLEKATGPALMAVLTALRG